MDTAENLTTPPDILEEEDGASSLAVDTRIVMMIIGSMGVLGNGFVITVAFSSKRLRRRLANLLIINQSMLDFTVGLLLIGDSAPKYMAGFSVEPKGLAGELYCKLWLSSSLLWSTLFSSTYNLVAITIERYIMVAHPVLHKTTFTRKRGICIIAVIWLWGLAFSLPAGITTSIIVDGFCVITAKYISPLWQQAYGVLTITVGFFIPLLVLPTLYTRMVVVMHRRSASPQVQSHESSTGRVNEQPTLTHVQKNLIKTLVIVTIAFFACWSLAQLTYLIYNLGLDYDLGGSFNLFAISVANFNCCINPFIYIVKYEDFKKAARGLFLRKSTQIDPSS